MNTDILIIGGGLSGLCLADHLHRKGIAFKLLEARSRFGGRIKTQHLDGASFDLGPAWFWPGQPRIAALIQRFGLNVFEQQYQGTLTFEDENGQVQRGRGYASMQGSYRLEGGFGALIVALANTLPQQGLQLNANVEGLEQTAQGVVATLTDGAQVTANKIVLALPPRIAASGISFDPKLPDQTTQSMNNISTWMAGQAKAVTIYDTPFWRDEGLSGDAMSRRGPMVEIHDASPAQGGPFALFGFIGVPPGARDDETMLREHVTAQFERLFGPKAGQPRHLIIKDWAKDTHTATHLDQAPLTAHPTYNLPHAMAHLWDGRLHFAGTEVAPQFGGYLEGALEAAENLLPKLER